MVVTYRGCFRASSILLVLCAERTAVAHPMGNFSISHYAGIRVERDGIRLQYRLDFAEIPSVQEMETLDSNKDGTVSDDERRAYLARKSQVFLNGLRLLINDQRVELKADTTDLQV